MKKTLSLILTLAILFTSTVSFAFSDVETSHWANEYIEKLTGEGIISGYEDGTYRPDGLVTKAELAKLVAVTFNADSGDEIFSDISSHWAEEYIKKCADLFYAPGDKFSPDTSATRAEVAYVLANVLSLEKTEELNFPDAQTVIDDMKDKVSAAVSAGLMNGYEDGTIRGNGFVTRAEIAALIVRALDYKAPSSETLGNVLLNSFNQKAKEGLTVLEIAEALIQNPSILFMGGAMPVEEGYLSGFDNYEVKGFKSGAAFLPMIGSIPFIGYVFELENEADVPLFTEGLKANANLRWNICVMADEMVSGSYGNKVFFVMCPSSLGEEPNEELPEEEPEEIPEELPEELPEEEPEEKPDVPSDKDHIYTLHPLKDLLLVKNATTTVDENGSEHRRLTYAIAGKEDVLYTSTIPMDNDLTVVGTKTSLASISAGDVFLTDTAFLGYLSTIVVVASFGNSVPSSAIPAAFSYGGDGRYEFLAGNVVSYENKTNTVILNVSDGTDTHEVIINKKTPVTSCLKKASSVMWDEESISVLDEGGFVFIRFEDEVATEVIISQ